VADQDPNDFHARSELESVLRIAGVAKSQAGDLAAAIQLIQEAAATGTTLHDHDPHNPAETVNASLDYYELGEVLRKRASEQRANKQDWQTALTSFKKAQTLISQVSPAAIYDANDREKLGKLTERIAECSEHAVS
jgi:tetratricopeptide (TPR) repeat protein